MADGSAHLLHTSGELVAGNCGKTVGSGQHDAANVRAADAGGHNLDQNVVRSNFGNRYLFDPEIAGRV
ncbi:hypothetical protein D3C72_2584770 [compost metagenome]